MSRIAPVLFVCACLGLLAVTARDVRTVRAQRSPALAAAAEQPANSAPAAEPEAFARVAAWPLFGVAPGQSEPVERTPGPAGTPAGEAVGVLPESTAPYQVFGLITSEEPARRRAFLGTDPATQRAYREGDTAPDGAEITTILPRAVVLTRNGAAEALKLPEDYPPVDDPNLAPVADALLPTADSAPQPPPVAETPLERVRQRIAAGRAATARGQVPAAVEGPDAP